LKEGTSVLSPGHLVTWSHLCLLVHLVSPGHPRRRSVCLNTIPPLVRMAQEDHFACPFLGSPGDESPEKLSQPPPTLTSPKSSADEQFEECQPCETRVANNTSHEPQQRRRRPQSMGQPPRPVCRGGRGAVQPSTKFPFCWIKFVEFSQTPAGPSAAPNYISRVPRGVEPPLSPGNIHCYTPASLRQDAPPPAEPANPASRTDFNSAPSQQAIDRKNYAREAARLCRETAFACLREVKPDAPARDCCTLAGASGLTGVSSLTNQHKTKKKKNRDDTVKRT